MTRTARTTLKVRWIASKDGIAHGQLPDVRTLCGAPVLPIRFAWPERVRCPLCAALAMEA